MIKFFNTTSSFVLFSYIFLVISWPPYTVSATSLDMHRILHIILITSIRFKMTAVLLSSLHILWVILFSRFSLHSRKREPTAREVGKVKRNRKTAPPLATVVANITPLLLTGWPKELASTWSFPEIN